MEKITAYADGLKGRFAASLGKRLAESSVLAGFDMDVQPRRNFTGGVLGYAGALRLTVADNTGQTIGVTEAPLVAETEDAIIARAEAAVSILWPEVPRPAPAEEAKAIVVAVEEPLPFAVPEAPEPLAVPVDFSLEDAPAPAPAEPEPKVVTTTKRR